MQSCENRNSRGTQWPFMNWFETIWSLLWIFVVSVFRSLDGEWWWQEATYQYRRAYASRNSIQSKKLISWSTFSFRLLNKQLDNLKNEKRSTAEICDRSPFRWCGELRLDSIIFNKIKLFVFRAAAHVDLAAIPRTCSVEVNCIRAYHTNVYQLHQSTPLWSQTMPDLIPRKHRPVFARCCQDVSSFCCFFSLKLRRIQWLLTILYVPVMADRRSEEGGLQQKTAFDSVKSSH